MNILSIRARLWTQLRAEADSKKIVRLISELGNRAKGAGRIYLVGGSSIVLLKTGRNSTIDVDLKLDPEPPGIFQAIAEIKEALDINIELASPDQFIPEVPGWRDRSRFIDKAGKVDFFHYDFYSQALAKIERGHDRDIEDAKYLIREGLVDQSRLLALFEEIDQSLIRFPAINAESFRRAVKKMCNQR